jgi:hypothetical protein
MILLVENCIKVDATTLLAKTRGGPIDDALVAYWTAEWNDLGPRRRVERLEITTTPQRLGGVHRWWRCPNCRRRCGILLAPDPESPLACRLCWKARYVSAFPHRQRRWKQFEWLLRHDHLTSKEQERQLAFLSGRRRRGIRRGRRIRQRTKRISQALEESLLQSLELWGLPFERAELEAKLQALRTLEAQVLQSRNRRETCSDERRG